MDKGTVTDQLKKMIFELLQINVPDGDTNLFSSDYQISPVTMVYLLLELENEFPVTVDDRFMDELPSITINHLADAICACAQ